jgi:gliding motility-associated-like protein
MAPNSFTPNGDGLNDTFIPEALMVLNKNFSMQIINTKSGGLVFETQNIESPWNGKYYNSGALLKAGLYAWTVKFEDGSVYSGTITLKKD